MMFGTCTIYATIDEISNYFAQQPHRFNGLEYTYLNWKFDRGTQGSQHRCMIDARTHRDPIRGSRYAFTAYIPDTVYDEMLEAFSDSRVTRFEYMKSDDDNQSGDKYYDDEYYDEEDDGVET